MSEFKVGDRVTARTGYRRMLCRMATSPAHIANRALVEDQLKSFSAVGTVTNLSNDGRWCDVQWPSRSKPLGLFDDTEIKVVDKRHGCFPNGLACATAVPWLD